MPRLEAKRVKGHTYYYLRHDKWVDGHARRDWEIYLGKGSDVGRLLQAQACKSGHEDRSKLQARVVEFGAVAALWDLAERLGVRQIIDQEAPTVRGGVSVGQYMVLATINRSVDACSKRKMADWYGQTALARWIPARQVQLSSQRFWDAMSTLDEKALREIELEIDRRLIQQFGVGTECLAYDATNFFTYIDTDTPSDLARRGHNKERRIDLRQISLALLVSREFHIPLFHEAYPGNRPDAPEFSRVVEELVARQKLLGADCEGITVVFDKGNNSEKNLQKLGSFHFVGSLVPTQHEDLLGIELKEFQPLPGGGLEGLRAYRTQKKVFGRPVTIVMTYNPELFAKQWRGLQWHMAKCEQGLRDLEGKLTRWREGQGRGKRPTRAGTLRQMVKILHARHMKQIFRVEVQKTPEGPRLVWSRDEAELTRLKEHLFGRTIIFTDQKDWTNEQIVLAYRGQYQIEQAFHWMKAPEIARWWPMHHWTDQKIRVHAFYCVLALTLLSLLRREVVRRGYDWGIEKILEVLGSVREVHLVGATRADPRVLPTVTSRKARALLEQLDLAKYRASRVMGENAKSTPVFPRHSEEKASVNGCGKSR